MPLNKYFSGKGEKVMSSMKKQYGEKGKSIFYATANKHRARSARLDFGPSDKVIKEKLGKGK